MTSDELLEQILLRPDDSVLRLAFADCIEEERGDSDWASYIRMAINTSPSEYTQRKDRSERLRRRWERELGLGFGTLARCERGFASKYYGLWQRWLLESEKVLARFPITEVEFNGTPTPKYDIPGTSWVRPAWGEKEVRESLGKRWPGIRKWTWTPVFDQFDLRIVYAAENIPPGSLVTTDQQGRAVRAYPELHSRSVVVGQAINYDPGNRLVCVRMFAHPREITVEEV